MKDLDVKIKSGTKRRKEMLSTGEQKLLMPHLSPSQGSAT